MSGIGIAVGVPLGIVLHKFVIKVAEVESVMFGRVINWQSYLFSILITIGFVLLVEIIMRKNIRSVDMLESMKANE